MKVFLVEDSDLLSERLADSLARIKGVELCGTSDSAEEAIEEIRQTQADVIILDIRLRQGNGLHVLESLKKPGHPPTVIVLTNYPYPQYRKKFLDAGADYFFDKSSEFTRVSFVLRGLLRKQRRRTLQAKKKLQA